MGRFATLAVLLQLGAVTTAAPPNIILFLVDDLGYGDLGFTGNPSTRTPNLDRLAFQGRRLTNWYSGAAVCSASRTALLTGRQPPRVGMVGVLNSLSKVGLPLSEVTIAEELRGKAGYSTLAVGKWHQGQQPQYLPAARGFDEFYGLPFSVDDGIGFISSCGAALSVTRTTPTPVGLGPGLPLPRLRQANGINVIEQQPADLTPLSEGLVNHTIDFLQRKLGKEAARKDATASSSPSSSGVSSPVFVWFAFGHVHTTGLDQMQYSGCAYQGSTPRGRFGDALAEVDAAVGAIVAEVARLGHARNTLTIFVSDNGPALRWGVDAGSPGIFAGLAAVDAHGDPYQNTGKGSTWEGGIRMPAFAYWPDTIEAGSVTGTVVSSMDIFPALVSLVGIKRNTTVIIDGKESLLDAMLLPSAEGDAPSGHTFLPFYNNVNIANASTLIFAARYGSYKAHWITSPGLLVGEVAEMLYHDPPIVFDVEVDPSEAFPLEELPDGLLHNLTHEKSLYEAQLEPIAIDPAYGYEWALCCGIGCTPDEDGSCACECSEVVF